MKSLRSEMVSAATVLAIPATMILAFPFDAATFKARPDAPAIRPGAAFIRLTAEEEVAAIRTAKGSWSSGADGVKSIHAELHFGKLPECENEPALDISERRTGTAPLTTCRWPPPFLPSQAASAPAKIPAQKEPDPQPAFSREELYRLD